MKFREISLREKFQSAISYNPFHTRPALVSPEPCRRCGVGSVPRLARIIFLVMMVIIADAQNTYFTVNSGPCTVDPSLPYCIRSPNFPSSYGNSQRCTITPTPRSPLEGP